MSKGKEIVGLDCDAIAFEGVRLILHTRFEEMCELRTGALDWSDIEGVHDMRVASRRLRSALRDFKPYLKRRKFRRAGDAIKTLADSLGAVRDKDVAIAALEKLAVNAPTDVAIGIEQFAAERRAQLEVDRTALVEAIADENIVTLRAEFDAWLESAFGSSRAGKSNVVGPQMEVTFREMGQRIVKSRMDELQGFRASLYRPLTTKPLHRMRIAAKRLRYAIELFAQCWDAKLVAFAKDVAELQTSLGELHDCDVWNEEFGGLLEMKCAASDVVAIAKTVGADRLRFDALVWLLGHFTKRRTNHYRDALARWHVWEATDFFGRLEVLMQCPQSDCGSTPADMSLAVAVAADLDSHPTS